MRRARQALGALIGVTLVATAFAAFAAAESTATPRPHDLKLFINGKRQAVEKLVGGADNYVPIDNGTLNVVARWRTNAAGTGYRVVIATTEPLARTVAACSTGTSCRAKGVTISPGTELAFKVTVVKARTKRVVGGFLVCLVGKS